MELFQCYMLTTCTHMHIYIHIGMDNQGHPTLWSAGCTASISDLDLKFHGGASWIYNLFTKIVKNKMKGDLEKLVRLDKYLCMPVLSSVAFMLPTFSISCHSAISYCSIPFHFVISFLSIIYLLNTHYCLVVYNSAMQGIRWTHQGSCC